jgi:glucose-6-phosphate 1-dehydrogenase
MSRPGFDRLAAHLDELDEERGTRGNRLFYLATQPSQFSEIVGPAWPGRARPREARRRLAARRHREAVRARPVSAQKLNREVGKVFRESQVYRIDHYLGKETVRNLMVFRFGNSLFEPIWNRRYVDHIQITVAESLGIENRGAFYEETGAARDVLQNHLLQLVCLVGMEPPAAFQADALRDEKVKILRALATHPEDVVRGQYGPGWVAGTKVPGYREEPDVDPESETEDVRRGTAADRRLALVGRADLRPDRQAAAETLDRDRDPIPRSAAQAVCVGRNGARTRTSSRSASSRTRASCCGSAPRSRASASTCAR